MDQNDQISNVLNGSKQWFTQKYWNFDVPTQDKGVFLFLHILNEILWNIEIWN